MSYDASLSRRLATTWVVLLGRDSSFHDTRTLYGDGVYQVSTRGLLCFDPVRYAAYVIMPRGHHLEIPQQLLRLHSVSDAKPVYLSSVTQRHDHLPENSEAKLRDFIVEN